MSRQQRGLFILGFMVVMTMIIGIFQSMSTFPAPEYTTTASPAAISATYYDDYALFDYKITKIEDGLYYGEATDGTHTGIVFTDKFLTGTVKVGSKVRAVFDKDDTVEGLIAVDVLR